MFLDTSRYYKQKTVTVLTKDNRPVKALKLRKLPVIIGKSYTVKDNDRLDVIANKNYKKPSWFWHIADANTELEAQKLVAETNRTINVP